MKLSKHEFLRLETFYDFSFILPLYAHKWRESKSYDELTLHKRLSFSLRISPVNVTKSTVSCGFVNTYWRNSWRKTSYFVQCNQPQKQKKGPFSPYLQKRLEYNFKSMTSMCWHLYPGKLIWCSYEVIKDKLTSESFKGLSVYDRVTKAKFGLLLAIFATIAECSGIHL